ncbi:MAG: hypothetical protein KAI66_21655 [Lentisphaeria bacterium]|nr:hypothetical protein [Lentisphaeria bacterium]
MAEELQALLDRIKTEGLEKAEEQKSMLLADAQAEAARLVTDAQAEATRIKTEAEREAGLLQEKGEQALAQAARDVLLSLKDQLQTRIATVAKSLVGEVLAADEIAQALLAVIEAYAASNGEVQQVQLLVKPEQLDEIDQALKGRLADELQRNTELKPVPGMTGGFRLVFNGQDVMYDFSDEALAEALAAYLNPRLAALLLADQG